MTNQQHDQDVQDLLNTFGSKKQVFVLNEYVPVLADDTIILFSAQLSEEAGGCKAAMSRAFATHLVEGLIDDEAETLRQLDLLEEQLNDMFKQSLSDLRARVISLKDGYVKSISEKD